MKRMAALISTIIWLGALAGGQDRARLNQIQQTLKEDIPTVLCVDQRFATAGQPAEAAWPKLAANGYRAVLNLRTDSEGVDLERERQMVEKAGLRYIHIPVVSSAPQPEQVDLFLKAVKDTGNHPMLIHCASGNRVGAFWMIYRVLEQGCTESQALEEAEKIGLKSAALKTFAQNYIALRKPQTKDGDCKKTSW